VAARAARAGDQAGLLGGALQLTDVGSGEIQRVHGGASTFQDLMVVYL
jgi:hypothetical protein